jgi:hypothetical protein
MTQHGPMGEDRFGMRCGPAVGQHLLHTRVNRMQAKQKATGPFPKPLVDGCRFSSPDAQQKVQQWWQEEQQSQKKR